MRTAPTGHGALAPLAWALAFGFVLVAASVFAAEPSSRPAAPEAPPASITDPVSGPPPQLTTPAVKHTPPGAQGGGLDGAPKAGAAKSGTTKSGTTKSGQAKTAPAPGNANDGAGNAGAGNLLGFGDQKDGTPVTVEADDGIEWQDKNQLYIARGNAKAVRGDVTVLGQVLTAYYRKTQSGGSDIWRLEANKAVKIATPTDTAVGDKAVYDVDNAIFVLTGKDLKLTTPKAVITARDSLEFWQQRQYAVARGAAKAVEQGKTIQAKVLTAHFKPDSKGQLQLASIEAFEDVLITTPTAVARAMYGNYNLDRSIAVLKGGVKITRGQDQLNGECAEVNLNTGISRLFSCTQTPVRGLLVPKQGSEGTPSPTNPLGLPAAKSKP